MMIGIYAIFLIYILIMIGLIVASYQDIRYREISGRLLFILEVLAIISEILLVLTNMQSAYDFIWLIPLVVVCLLFQLGKISCKSVGDADVILVGIIGLSLGRTGFVIAIASSLFLLFLFSIILVVFRKADGGLTIPAIPFLTVGAIVGVLIG